MNHDSPWMAWLIGLLLFGGLFGASELGHFLGRRKQAEVVNGDHLGPVQGAILGLLALLLGFSFSAAAGRFSERVALIGEEANTLRALWLRLDLVPGEPQSALRADLRRYLDERIAFYDARAATDHATSLARTEAMQARLWTLLTAATKTDLEVAGLLLPAANDVVAAHARREAASERHLPGLILGLLLACSAVSVGAVSYGCGVTARRSTVLTTTLAFLVAAVLWAIIDLDHPRRGLIRTGQEPLQHLQATLGRAPQR